MRHDRIAIVLLFTAVLATSCASSRVLADGSLRVFVHVGLGSTISDSSFPPESSFERDPRSFGVALERTLSPALRLSFGLEHRDYFGYAYSYSYGSPSEPTLAYHWGEVRTTAGFLGLSAVAPFDRVTPYVQLGAGVAMISRTLNVWTSPVLTDSRHEESDLVLFAGAGLDVEPGDTIALRVETGMQRLKDEVLFPVRFGIVF